MIKVSKGDKVILKGFTGIKLGIFEVAKATDKSVTVLKKDGSKMIFSKKTGKQTNMEEGKEKYANSIMEDDGSYVPPVRGGKSKKSKASATKPAAKKKAKTKKEVYLDEDEIVDEDELIEEIEEEEEEEVKPKKKKTKTKKVVKPAAKKKAKAKKEVEPEDDEFEDDDEFDDED